LTNYSEKLVQRDRALWYSFSDDVIFAKLEEPFFEMNTEKLEKIKAALARSRSWLEQIRITLYNKKAVISMSTLGKTGRFGNQIFQYAFLKLYAKEHDLRIEIPSWIGQYLFGHDDPPISQNLPVIEEQPQPYKNSESLILTAKEPLKNVDFLGWFQFYTSYHRPHKKYLLSLFQPVPEIAANMKGAIDYLKKRGKTIVCLHLRRGDYQLPAPHQSFFTIPPNQWYIEWLEYIWASLDHPVLYIASDDIENVINDFIHYHPLTIKDLNTELPEAPFYPDFFILTQCDILAISNSTFSFSAAMLNQRAKHFFRPDFIHEKLVSFDPWDSKPTLWSSRILMVCPTMLALKRPLDSALAKGHEVLLIGDTNPYLIKQPPNYHFIEFVTPRCKYDSTSNSSIDTPIDELSANVAQLKEIAATFQPDIIHVHAINNITQCCVLAGLHPLVVSAWGFLNELIEEPVKDPSPEDQIPDNNSSTEKRTLQDIYQQVISHLDVLIVDNPALADACQGLLSSTQRIENIGLGTDTQHFHPNYASNVAKWRQVLKIPDNATVFFSPCGWGWSYGQKEIFQAFAKSYADLPQPAILLFIELSRDHQDFIKKLNEEICAEAKTLGIADSLRWLPQLPHKMLPTAYNLADVVINYPFSDAFPSTLVEAAACQRPVITSDLQAYRGTFVEEYYTLVEPNNAEALAKAMVEVGKQSPAERISRLEKLRQHIVENYDEKVMRQKLMILYEELASSYSNSI
jgi:glycosyltransferase involved in cell wall biosynthesis